MVTALSSGHERLPQIVRKSVDQAESKMPRKDEALKEAIRQN